MTRLLKSDQPASTPAALGYRMPAEWEPHAATWLAWPHNRTDWPGKFEAIQWVYADIVRHLARVERVEILVNDEAAQARARAVLRKCHVPLDTIRFHCWPTNRGWLRDSGPIFVKRGAEIAITHWGFNAWAKYDDWQLDARIPSRVARRLRLPWWTPEIELAGRKRRLVLEGGSIDVNGQGLMLTTEECLLSNVQQRNPGLSREPLESSFARYLGVKKVLWLERGIVGDDTHGHVDDLARFVAPDTIVTMVESDPADANFQPLQENLRRLRSFTGLNGRALRIVELPMPAPVVFRGQRLPASYANFYIANRVVLAPTFNDPNDRVALNTLAELFPGRDVAGIHCGDLIWGLGAIHCMTQQQPA